MSGRGGMMGGAYTTEKVASMHPLVPFRHRWLYESTGFSAQCCAVSELLQSDRKLSGCARTSSLVTQSVDFMSQPPGAPDNSCSHPEQSAAIQTCAMLAFFDSDTQLLSLPSVLWQQSRCSGWRWLHLALGRSIPAAEHVTVLVGSITNGPLPFFERPKSCSPGVQTYSPINCTGDEHTKVVNSRMRVRSPSGALGGWGSRVWKTDGGVASVEAMM